MATPAECAAQLGFGQVVGNNAVIEYSLIFNRLSESLFSILIFLRILWPALDHLGLFYEIN